MTRAFGDGALPLLTLKPHAASRWVWIPREIKNAAGSFDAQTGGVGLFLFVQRSQR